MTDLVRGGVSRFTRCRISRNAVLVFGVCCLGLASACGHSEAGQESSADLAAIVLPPSALGSLADGLGIVAANSGPQTADDQAADSPDPDDNGADYSRQGYVDGYDLVLRAMDPPKTHGVSFIGTGVLEFTTPKGARAFVERTVAFDEGRDGEIEDFVIYFAERFDPGNVGDFSIGVLNSQVLFDTGVLTTEVWFTVGPIAGAVAITTIEGPERKSDAVRLARAMVQRIRAAEKRERDHIRDRTRPVGR